MFIKKITRKNLLKVIPASIFSLVFLQSASAKKSSGGKALIDGVVPSRSAKKNKYKSPEYVFEYKALINLSKRKIVKDYGYKLIEANPAKNRVRLTFQEKNNNEEVMFYIGLNSNEKKGLMRGKYVTLIDSPDLRINNPKKQNLACHILDIFDHYEHNKRSLALN